MSEETGTKILTDEDKRAQLREKIGAAEQRHADRSVGDIAKEAAETVTDFAKRHPLATVAGAIGLGLAIGAMTRPGRRLTRRTGVLAAMAADTAVNYGLNAFDRAGTATSAAARTGSDGLHDLGETLSSAARSLRRDAAYRADVAGDALRGTKRRAGRKASRTMRDLRSRLNH